MPPFDTFLQAVQRAALPAIWSRGVALAREALLIEDRRTDQEIIVRVQVINRPVSSKVTLWPTEEDWFCDCGDRNDPCVHIAAAVVALKNGTLRAEASAQAPKGPALRYRFLSKADVLLFERRIVRDAGEETLKQSLVSLVGGISSGRIAGGPIPATREDFAIDALLGEHAAGGALPAPLLARLFAALKDESRVTLDDQPVKLSAEGLGLTVAVEDAGTGFRIRALREFEAERTFQNGAALVAGTLHPLHDAALTPEERELVLSDRTLSFDQAGRIAAEIVPRLQSKLAVRINTERLPRLVEAAPRILLKIEGGDDRLSVLALLVYGDPPIAEIHEDRLEALVPGILPVRDPGAEKSCLRRLQAELHLQPRQRVELRGREAVAFLEKSRGWHTELAKQDAGAGLIGPPLLANLSVTDAGLELSFATAASGGTPRRADSGRVLQAWQDGETHVPLLGGGWAALPADWLERYGERARRLLEFRQDGAKSVPPYCLPELISLSEEAGTAALPENLARLKARLNDPARITDAPLPADLRAELRDYQKRGVAWLRFLAETGMGALLADDMGLGKTLQVLAALDPSPARRTLIIAPTSVLQAWSEQLERFRPGLAYSLYYGSDRKLDERAAVVLTTYGILRLDQKALAGQSWDTIVLDEAQTIKNPESQVAQAAYTLEARARVALSGTPIENRLSDLWSQFRFLNPGLLGTHEEFRTRFEAPISRGDSATTPKALTELRGLIRPFILRRMKGEVARELPPKTEVVLRSELTAEEGELYRSILLSARKEVLSRLEEGTGTMAALEALLRLRQACCHPALIPGWTPPLGASDRSSSKLDLLLETLEESLGLGHRALIFSQWTSLLDLLEPLLRSKGISFSRLDGSTRDRQAVVEEFQDPRGPAVLLISLKAGGVGLTLTAADHVFILDPWWNPAAEDQAADRAHRIGQENPVMVYRLAAKDTVEEKVLALQKRKLELSGAALQGSGGGALNLTQADLAALFT